MKRVLFHVVQDPEAARHERWTIKRNGVVVARRRLQVDAVKDGRRRAKEERPSQLLVHGRSGRILLEFTYGADPKRYWG